jgi:tetratricopeptide (TPR) repeat protein
MDAQTSKAKFQEADQLFRSGQYQEALVILEELNSHHPNAKNVMYPAAMCLDKLGRSQEALPLCNHLIQTFQDPRAEALKADIEGRALSSSLDSMYDMNNLDLEGDLGGADILDIPSTTVPHKTVEPEGIPWVKYGLIAAAVVVFLLVAIVPVLVYEAPDPATVAEEPPSVGVIYLGALAAFLTFVVFQSAGAYLALMLMRSLPHQDFASNAFNLGVSMFLASLLEGSFLGIILTAIYFAKAYDLGLGGVFFLYVCRIVFGGVGLFLGIMIFFGSIAMVVPPPA